MGYSVTVRRTAGNGDAVTIPWSPVVGANGTYPVDVHVYSIDKDTVAGVTCSNSDTSAQAYKLKGFDPPTGTLRTIEMEEGSGGGG